MGAERLTGTEKRPVDPPVRRPRLEAMEPRLLLSGDVTVNVIDGDVFILGDCQDNAIVIDGMIDSAADGSAAEGDWPVLFMISGVDDTTVNGETGWVNVEGVTGSVYIALDGGNDSASLVWGCAPGSLAFLGGAGDDELRLYHWAVGEGLYVRGGWGGDGVAMEGAFVRGGAVLNFGRGDSETKIDETAIEGDLLVTAGYGFDRFSLANGSAVGGDVKVRTDGGGSRTTIDASTVGGDVTLAGGGAGRAVWPWGKPQNRYQFGNALAPADVTFTKSRGDNEAAIADSSIDGGLKIVYGYGDDVVDLLALRLGGPCLINTDGGDDLVQIDDSSFGGTFSLKTGRGRDRLELETTAPAADVMTAFAESVYVKMGTDSDTVLVGRSDEPPSWVVFVGSVLFHGGRGWDAIDTNGNAGLDETNCRSFEDASFDAEPALTDLERLVADNNAFAMDLYQALRGEQGSLFYSPFSISTALAMTYAGARGETAQQMAATMRFSLPQARLHGAFADLIAGLAGLGQGPRLPGSPMGDTGDPFVCEIANSLWGQMGYPFLPTFLNTIASSYGGPLRRMDFIHDPEGSRQIINDWVSEKTHDRIQDLLKAGDIHSLTRLVLVNALWCKGSWLFPFDERDTQTETFHAADGDVDVQMMHQWHDLLYAEGANYQAVELPYVGQEASMVVLLPGEGQFEAFEQSLSGSVLDEIVSELSSRRVNLSLPKFEYGAEFDLSETLKAMGMPVAFDPFQANFSGMDGMRNLYIDRVRHKAWVAVDESGTEAAAATAVMMAFTSVPEDPPPVFTADRPFIYVIRDVGTSSVLFVGRVSDTATFES
jgi:serpin B